MANLEKLGLIAQASTSVVLAVATVFVAFVAVSTWGLSEQFGRLDTRVGTIEADIKVQTDLIGQIERKLTEGFATVDAGLNRIDLRLGQAELQPEKLLNMDAMLADADIKPLFYGGSLYYLPRSAEADARLSKAGFKRDLLEGFLPGYLIREDAFQYIPVKD